MGQLSDREVEHRALDLVQYAHGARSSAEFRAHALAALSELVAYDNAVFSEPESERPLVTHAVDESAAKFIELCDRNFARYAPEVGHAMATAQRLGGILDHDFFAASERSRMAFYSEIMGPQKVDATLVLVPKWRGRVLGMIRLQRAHGSREFQSEDLALAMRLLPAAALGLAALRPDAREREGPLPELSQRETEIARHVARGLTTPQIALLLGTSKLTVRNQIGRIFDRLGVASRAELAAWVARAQGPRR